MHNLYFIMLATVISLQMFANSMVSLKIDSAMNVINGELIAMCVTQKSKIEAQDYNDITLLAIDHEKLDYVLKMLLNKNLAFAKYELNYYFYDSVTMVPCSIGNSYCNSVQIKILITYKKKKYEDIIRYEPIEI